MIRERPRRSWNDLSANEALHTETAVERDRPYRRQDMVLFADLAGFTMLGKQRDAEEGHWSIDRRFELITAAVQRGPCTGATTRKSAQPVALCHQRSAAGQIGLWRRLMAESEASFLQDDLDHRVELLLERAFFGILS
jgi:hypothetical protein